MIFANPVRGHIVPYGEARPPDDPYAFRVTQRFTDINPAFPRLGQHGALDLGNFRCGDPVFAAAGGTARTLKDSAGALIVVIQHSDGWTTVYAHLQSFAITQGVSTSVRQGQQIGSVGSTGLGGVCHLHFEAKKNGTKVDPWPLLKQNQETDMQIKGKFVRHVSNRKTSLTIDANFRAGPGRTFPTLRTFGNGTAFIPIIQLEGELVGDSVMWYGGFLWVDGWTYGVFHGSVLSTFVEIESTGVSSATLAAEVKKATKLGASGAAGAAQKYADSL